MNCTLRTETEPDHPRVAAIVEAAFRDDPHGDHTEHHLVARLRKAPGFIPDLSIVAEVDGQLRGHILLTPIRIVDESREHPSLALAPVSVEPGHQSRGLGGALIEEAHRRALKSGHGSVVLLGHPAYYPRFGYRPAAEFGIVLPFEVPAEYCMAVELRAGALDGVAGTVRYPPEFFGESP
ncbi:GCN5 family acetyltransferase [Acidobacteria bacterium Mor1]|nr:GCN5 family acetyltransferase [Acidobacteria bacterium Mor1]